MVSYKRIDLAVRACNALGKKLVVIGHGPDREALEAIAGPTVTFLGRASDADVEYIVPRCNALLFPGEEDFGMAPLEVAAAFNPCIAYRAAGTPWKQSSRSQTGVFFDHQTPEDLANAIERFERQQWNPDLLVMHAESFGVHVFQKRFHSFLRRIGVPLPDYSCALQIYDY